MKSHNIISLLICFVFLFSCQNEKQTDSKEDTSNTSTSFRFHKIPSSQSGITFANNITENEQKNYFNFEYIYNGAGVATADFDNNGTTDIFFVGNEVPNKLYLNNGGFKFTDVSKAAGVEGDDGWANGVSIVDINQDGWMDIYVSVGGWQKDPNKRKNKLYVNSGSRSPFRFVEQAEEYGLAESGYSIQSSFFDYDKDGDLDVYITNHPFLHNLDLKTRVAKRTNPDEPARDKLYRNNGDNTFTEVSRQAKIVNYGHGLGLVTADLNNDGWPDIYVGNDYKEPDYLYVNQKDGTFKNEIESMTGHTSFFSMGVDIADINNDGLEDIFSCEMLPGDYKRSKTNMAPMDAKTFYGMLQLGLHHQYMHNTLQLNRGDGRFSEIAQMAGVAKTDWSWACFLSDFDNDGFRDLFVANGYKRDVFDRDYEKEADKISEANNNQMSIQQLYEVMPKTKLQNFFYLNNSDFTFSDRTNAVGLNEQTLTQGAAIADFDNDGDLDLVLNNLDEEAILYENESATSNNFLNVKLAGNQGNIHGLGAKVKAVFGNKMFYNEIKTTRGFQSSVPPIAHFGLGKIDKIEKLEVEWLSGLKTIVENVGVNQMIEVKESEGKAVATSNSEDKKMMSEITDKVMPTPFVHQENPFDDLQNQILLPHKQSQNGPFVSVGDVNGDNLEDFYVGGAHLQAGGLYLQTSSSTFKKGNTTPFEADRAYEDMGSAFFDFDGDGDLDLYVASGGFEFPHNTPAYQDRLYINDGQGNFSNQSMNTLPPEGISGSCVVPSDFDGDGDLDLFVGGRVFPNAYPYPVSSILMKNEGGKFVHVNDTVLPELNNIGMVTTAIWTDINSDQKPDLMVAGEWMPIKVFVNEGSKFRDATDEYGLSETTGWWNRILETDLDKDGISEYVAGNIGLNHKFQASKKKTFDVYCSDFDKNGSYDIVLAKYNEGEQVPIRGRECSSQQMPFVSQKFPTYESFAEADISDILGEEKSEALHYQAKEFASVVLKKENGGFTIERLPIQCQFSSVNGIVTADINKDGKEDLVCAGNLFQTEPETTRADASLGLVMLNQDKGLIPIEPYQSGLSLPYDVKDLKIIKIGSNPVIIAVSNNEKLRFFK